MWYYLQLWFHDVIRAIGRLDREEWICIFVAAMIFGAFCLRGFGSRTNY